MASRVFRGILLASGLAAACGVWAAPAAAQEWRAVGGSDAGDAGPRGTVFGFGAEALFDLRETTVDSFEENLNAPPPNQVNPPPAPATEWDEDLIEHRAQFHSRVSGLFATFQAVGGGSSPWRAGVRVGGVQQHVIWETFPGNYSVGFPIRLKFEFESKTGLGGGLFADVRFPLQGQPVWLAAGFDAWLGQVAIDNSGAAVDGESFFAQAALSGRVGFVAKPGVSLFVGLGLTYFYDAVELRAVPEPAPAPPTDAKSTDIQFGTRSIARVLLGVEFGKGTESLGRLQVGIWKPGADFAVSVLAMVRV